jgi:hypothetical protein
MMNKKILPLVILLVLAGGVYYWMNMKPSAPGSVQTAKEVMSEAAEFSKAMESGKPTTCVMTKGTDSMEYNLKGKMMAAKINTTTEGKTTVSHMINDEKHIYMWADGEAQGSKIAVPTEEETQVMADQAKQYENTTPTLSSEADYDSFKQEGYTIDCKSGGFSDSIFTPPDNIKFIDPSQMMKAIPSPDANGRYDMSRLEELQKQYGGMPTSEDQ